MGKPKNCNECSIVYTPKSQKSKYCSNSCKNSARRTLIRNKTCVNCLKSFNSKYGKYCSQQCHSDYLVMNCFIDWYVNDQHFENRVLRNYLSIWKGYICSGCGISEWNGLPITLEVEHIDGNSENSKKENVCLICPNCHSQTSTYKGKNRGNGRHKRLQRYHEGKSY